MGALFDPKDSVRCASSVNVVLNAPSASIDGITMKDKDRVLLLSQTNPTQNGIYEYAIMKRGRTETAILKRAADALKGGLTPGATVFVEKGATNGNSAWVLLSPDSGEFVIEKTPAVFDCYYTKKRHYSAEYTESAEWIVSHNLGTFDVLYRCYDEEGRSISPDSEIAFDENTLKLRFSPAKAGWIVVHRSW